MDERVRPALLSDAAAIAELEGDARVRLVDQRGGPEWLAGESPWNELDVARRAASSSWHLVIAEIDEVPVGFAAGELRSNTCFVQRLFVEPEARELGLGEFMLQAIIEWATAAGTSAIESVALPGDRETKNLFERFGMKARLLVVRRQLIDDEPVDAS